MSILGAAREKYWEEKTADEKIECLAGHIERITEVVKNLERQLIQISYTTSNHRHMGSEGNVMLPVGGNRSVETGMNTWLPEAEHILNREKKYHIVKH